MVDVGSAFDYAASLLIIASIIAGLVSVGGKLGSASDLLGNVVSQPASFGVGSVLFFVGFDTWVPALPRTFLDQYGLGWLTHFYWYAGGEFIPHWSLEVFFFSLVVTVFGVWLFLYVTEYDFWFTGLGVSVLLFMVSWWVWQLIAWNLMHVGGGMMGLSSEQTTSLWYASVTATESNILQMFFLVSLPVSAIYLVRKVASLI